MKADNVTWNKATVKLLDLGLCRERLRQVYLQRYELGWYFKVEEID